MKFVVHKKLFGAFEEHFNVMTKKILIDGQKN